MPNTPRIHVLTGGPYHPVAEQFSAVPALLGDRVTIALREGTSVFDDLGECDLLVAGGLHWTGMDDPGHIYPDGVAPSTYRRPDEAQQQAFVDYIASGRPVLAWHGGTGSFDDWPEFGRLLGFCWVWGTTQHSAYGNWHVEIEPTGHPVVAGVDAYDIDDELYYDVAVAPDLDVAVHASAPYEGRQLPMVITAEGGRIAGAGRTAFLANGHDMRALESSQFSKIVVNTIDWLLAG